MTIEWHIEEEPPEEPEPEKRVGWWWPLVLVLGGAVGLALLWWWGAERLSTAVSPTQTALQQLLDTTAVEILTPDPLTHLTLDPAWRVAQWQPHQRTMWTAQPTLTNFSQPAPSAPDYWLNVSWLGEDGEARQRVLFATQLGDRFYWQANAPDFWGVMLRAEYPWGVLRFRERDQDLHTAVGEFITSHCASRCADLNLTITLATDDPHAPATNPTEIRLPSPRLLALTSDGQPAPEFFAHLAYQLDAFSQSAPLQFGVPEAYLRPLQTVARQYNAQTPPPPLPVEIVPLDTLPPDPAEWLPLVDGALLTPAPAQIEAGLVWDLTPLLGIMSEAEVLDFYEPLWQGGQWLERQWVLPHTAVGPILYYDPTPYRTLRRPVPTAHSPEQWDWAQLQQDAEIFQAEEEWRWGLVAREPAWLPPEALPAALMPDPLDLTGEQGEIFFYNQVSSSTRHTPLWVDTAQNFEHHQQSRQARVAPWPAAWPLRVSGGVISQQSARPTAVWAWLTYLSYQYPERTSRQIPARPSVARTVGFWESLPTPLALIMQDALTDAQPLSWGVRE